LLFISGPAELLVSPDHSVITEGIYSLATRRWTFLEQMKLCCGSGVTRGWFLIW